MENILTIIDLQDDEIVDVLSILVNFRSVPQSFFCQTNGKISLVHKSLAEYLTDNTRKRYIEIQDKFLCHLRDSY